MQVGWYDQGIALCVPDADPGLEVRGAGRHGVCVTRGRHVAHRGRLLHEPRERHRQPAGGRGACSRPEAAVGPSHRSALFRDRQGERAPYGGDPVAAQRDLPRPSERAVDDPCRIGRVPAARQAEDCRRAVWSGSRNRPDPGPRRSVGGVAPARAPRSGHRHGPHHRRFAAEGHAGARLPSRPGLAIHRSRALSDSQPRGSASHVAGAAGQPRQFRDPLCRQPGQRRCSQGSARSDQATGGTAGRHQRSQSADPLGHRSGRPLPESRVAGERVAGGRCCGHGGAALCHAAPRFRGAAQEHGCIAEPRAADQRVRTAVPRDPRGRRRHGARLRRAGRHLLVVERSGPR